ncbi:MAG: peptidoglycan DD-metalloendopeptidase family protein [Patescibacteria group bacterium]
MKILYISLVAILLISPHLTLAEYGSYPVDRSRLDSDTVASIPIPILFGVSFADIDPDFGEARDDGERSHEGEDLLAPQGAPVVSPTAAIVLKTGEEKSAGKYVYTANPGGETFRYLHLDTIANLNSGDELEPGDFIGTVGDTGNAPPGVYHLHFEIRDEDDQATDPYPRLTDSFTLKEKMSFLRGIFSNIRNDEEYAEFLVANFATDLETAVQAGLNVPPVVEETLAEKGIVSQRTALQELSALVASIPKAVASGLTRGDQGSTVALLQLYLIYASDGPARDALASVGPTGYFGNVTVAALTEYQEDQVIAFEKGVYDEKTRETMMKRSVIILNLP